MKDSLEERYAKAEVEREKLSEWFNSECRKIETELKKSGKYVVGLDTNRSAFEPIKKEYQRRFLELYDKYDLPNKPIL